MTATHIDPHVLDAARRQLETAARRLAAIARDPDDDHDRNKQRLAEAISNAHAALARLEA